jgi:uncharacterized membrane protein YdjX (TVP38/TMEM64 family)
MPNLSDIKTFIVRNQKTLGLILLFTIIPLVSSAILLTQAIHFEIENESGIPLSGWITVSVILCFTMAFAITPTTFIALMGGFFVGWQSALPIIICYTVASVFGFQLGKIVDSGRLVRSLGYSDRSLSVLQKLRNNEIWLVFFSRISPILPFAVMNIVLSGLRVSFRNFLWAGLIGMLPRTLFFIWVGTQAKSIQHAWTTGKSLPLSQVLTLSLILVSVLGLSLVIKRSIKQARA